MVGLKMTTETKTVLMEISRISSIIANSKSSDCEIAEAIQALDAMGPDQKPQVFVLRCAASEKLSTLEEKALQICKSVENGMKLYQAQPDPDLELELKRLIRTLEKESINSEIQQKIESLLLVMNRNPSQN